MTTTNDTTPRPKPCTSECWARRSYGDSHQECACHCHPGREVAPGPEVRQHRFVGGAGSGKCQAVLDGGWPCNQLRDTDCHSVEPAAAKCPRCGHTEGVDANGWCLHGRPYVPNLPDSNQRAICPCRCRAATPPEPAPLSVERHCKTCTCGQDRIDVEWSDRRGSVDLNNPSSVALTVISCALDHEYDRTVTGIPYGIPDSLAELLAPVVAKHLSAVEPDWKNKTVYMDYEDGSQEAFQEELEAAVRQWKGEKDGES